MFITISARDYSSKGGTENSAFDASKKPEGMEAVRRLGRLHSFGLPWPRKKKFTSISIIMVPVIAPAPRLTTCLHMPLSDDTAMLTCMVLAVACSCGSSQTLLTSSRSGTPRR